MFFMFEMTSSNNALYQIETDLQANLSFALVRFYMYIFPSHSERGTAFCNFREAAAKKTTAMTLHDVAAPPRPTAPRPPRPGPSRLPAAFSRH